MRLLLVASAILVSSAASSEPPSACDQFRRKHVGSSDVEELKQRALKLMTSIGAEATLAEESMSGGIAFTRAVYDLTEERGAEAKSQLQAAGVDCINAIRKDALGW